MPIPEDLQEAGIVVGSLALFCIFYFVMNNVFALTPLIANADYIFDPRMSEDLAHNYSTKIDSFNTAHGLIQTGTTLRTKVTFAEITLRTPATLDVDASGSVFSRWFSWLNSPILAWLHIFLIGVVVCLVFALCCVCYRQHRELPVLRSSHDTEKSQNENIGQSRETLRSRLKLEQIRTQSLERSLRKLGERLESEKSHAYSVQQSLNHTRSSLRARESHARDLQRLLDDQEQQNSILNSQLAHTKDQLEQAHDQLQNTSGQLADTAHDYGLLQNKAAYLDGQLQTTSQQFEEVFQKAYLLRNFAQHFMNKNDTLASTIKDLNHRHRQQHSASASTKPTLNPFHIAPPQFEEPDNESSCGIGIATGHNPDLGEACGPIHEDEHSEPVDQQDSGNDIHSNPKCGGNDPQAGSNSSMHGDGDQEGFDSKEDAEDKICGTSGPANADSRSGDSTGCEEDEEDTVLGGAIDTQDKSRISPSVDSADSQSGDHKGFEDEHKRGDAAPKKVFGNGSTSGGYKQGSPRHIGQYPGKLSPIAPPFMPGRPNSLHSSKYADGADLESSGRNGFADIGTDNEWYGEEGPGKKSSGYSFGGRIPPIGPRSLLARGFKAGGPEGGAPPKPTQPGHYRPRLGQAGGNGPIRPTSAAVGKQGDDTGSARGDAGGDEDPETSQGSVRDGEGGDGIGDDDGTGTKPEKKKKRHRGGRKNKTPDQRRWDDEQKQLHGGNVGQGQGGQDGSG